MRNKINHIVLGSALSLLISSCSFLELEPNVIEASTFYNSEEEVIRGLAGVYGALGSEAVYGNYYSLMLSNIDDSLSFMPMMQVRLKSIRRGQNSMPVSEMRTLSWKL